MKFKFFAVEGKNKPIKFHKYLILINEVEGSKTFSGNYFQIFYCYDQILFL